MGLFRRVMGRNPRISSNLEAELVLLKLFSFMSASVAHHADRLIFTLFTNRKLTTEQKLALKADEFFYAMLFGEAVILEPLINKVTPVHFTDDSVEPLLRYFHGSKPEFLKSNMGVDSLTEYLKVCDRVKKEVGIPGYNHWQSLAASTVIALPLVRCIEADNLDPSAAVQTLEFRPLIREIDKYILDEWMPRDEREIHHCLEEVADIFPKSKSS